MMNMMPGKEMLMSMIKPMLTDKMIRKMVDEISKWVREKEAAQGGKLVLIAETTETDICIQLMRREGGALVNVGTYWVSELKAETVKKLLN